MYRMSAEDGVGDAASANNLDVEPPLPASTVSSNHNNNSSSVLNAVEVLNNGTVSSTKETTVVDLRSFSSAGGRLSNSSPLPHVLVANNISQLLNGHSNNSSMANGSAQLSPRPNSSPETDPITYAPAPEDAMSAFTVKRLAVPPLLSSTHTTASTSRQASASNSEAPLKRKRMVFGVLITVGICISYVGASQLAKSALAPQSEFSAPVFLVWLNTSFNLILFPLFFVGSAIRVYAQSGHSSAEHQRSLKSILKHSTEVFGSHGLTIRSFLSTSVPFTVLWFCANVAYVYALKFISVTETSALFASNVAFVYLLSWICLHEKFIALRVIGILLSITGIILTAHGEGISSMSFIGVILAVSSSAASALYKVLFKRLAGDASFGQVSLFLSMLGLVNVFLCWTVVLLLLLTGAETADWTAAPWGFLCGSGALSLCYNFLINLGVAYTYPLLISVGIFLGTPLNSVIDTVFRQDKLVALQIIGAICILSSFCLLLAPENFCNSCLQTLGCRTAVDQDRYPKRPKTAGHRNHRRSRVTDSN